MQSVRPRPEQKFTGPADEATVDKMTQGLIQNKLSSPNSHPLQLSEKKYAAHQSEMDMNMLRNIQGIHAPLRLQMERKAASRVARLPGIASSNVMLDTLTGAEDTLSFEDILCNTADSEVMGEPHLMQDRKEGIL